MLSTAVKDMARLLMREGMPLADAVLAAMRIQDDTVNPQVGDALYRAAKFNPFDRPIKDVDTVSAPGYMDRIRDANLAIRPPRGVVDLGTITMQEELRRKAAERYALELLGFTEPPMGSAGAYIPQNPLSPTSPLALRTPRL